MNKLPKTPDAPVLEWFEIEALYLWRSLGCQLRDIAAALGVPQPALAHHLHRGKKDRAAVKMLDSWKEHAAKSAHSDSAELPQAEYKVDVARLKVRGMGLEPCEAQAVVLWRLEGYSLEDIANGMGLSQDVVRGRIYRTTLAHRQLSEISCWGESE